MCKGKGTSLRTKLWSSHTLTGSFQTLTRQICSFQNHSHYWEEYSINFRFLYNVRYVTRMSHAKFHCNKLTTVKDIQDYANLIFGTRCRNVLIRAWIIRRRRPAVGTMANCSTHADLQQQNCRRNCFELCDRLDLSEAHWIRRRPLSEMRLMSLARCLRGQKGPVRQT